MKALLSLVVFLAVSIPAFARIGETYEQCVARYGTPIEPLKGEDAKFQKAGLVIKITFLKGIAGSIWIENAAGEKYPLATEVIDVLLKANTTDGEWMELPTKSEKKPMKMEALERKWKSESGATACYSAFIVPPETAVAIKADGMYHFSIQSAAFNKWRNQGVKKTMEVF